MAALTATGWPVEYADVSEDCQAYFRLLCALWAEARDFLIVEHDMVATAEAIEEMDRCPKTWCTNPYPCNEWGTLIEVAFGFSRFRRPLMEKEPDAMEATVDVPVMVNGHLWPPRHFQGLDCRFDCVMGARSYRQHAHQAVIEHLHVYP